MENNERPRKGLFSMISTTLNYKDKDYKEIP
jgi:hypothetical protein